MTIYTTLGEGANTAVLFDNADGSHRKVTTLDHPAARDLAHALSRAHETIANALWDVAIAYDGAPAAARRTLLTRFDTAVAGHAQGRRPEAPADCWQPATGLIDRVAATIAGQPKPVIAAVRRELADAVLADLDGVLVAGVLWASCHRPAFLRLVLNQVMGSWTTDDGRRDDPFFDGLDDVALALDSVTVEPRLRVPMARYYSDEDWTIVELLRDQRSCRDDLPGEGSGPGIFADSGQEHPELELHPGHLRAWMSTHRPDLLEVHGAVGA